MYARKYALLVVLLVIFMINNVAAQLTINTATAEEMVNELIGPGVLVSNISYTGDDEASGIFSGYNNSGLTSGVVLTSGLASDLPGPSSNNASTINGLAGDLDLDALISNNTNDASVLEFDFVPAQDSIELRYVFGSEEYPEYIGQYNDVFAFFISGPRPAGGNYDKKNIAIVPRTLAMPVSIDNINCGDPPNPPSGGTNCEYYVNNLPAIEEQINYDGFTVVLTAKAAVIPCSTYHFKFAIADAVDGMLDSGVLLESESFTSYGTEIDPVASTPNADPFAVEGCLDINIGITLLDISPTPTIITFEAIEGTATNGVDYTFLDLSHTIPANTLSINIPLEIFTDGITEGEESIIITHKEVDCVTNTYTVFIRDEIPPVEVHLSNNATAICGNGTEDLTTTAPFDEYLWNTGETTRTINVGPGSYTCTAKDEYGCPSSASISLSAIAPPPARTIKRK